MLKKLTDNLTLLKGGRKRGGYKRKPTKKHAAVNRCSAKNTNYKEAFKTAILANRNTLTIVGKGKTTRCQAQTDK